MKTTVQLLSWTERPIETLLALWEASRTDGDLTAMSRWSEVLTNPDNPRYKDAWDTFYGILDSAIPVAENVSFTFILDNVSIELREQMVRHRIGQHHGDRVGLDFVPELADSTWWSQSMRVLDMGRFADLKKYRVPDSITRETEGAYHGFMKRVQDFYNQLLDSGVPREDARAVLPLACSHRISWTLNLAALKHVIGKRGCWILQLGLWEPVIKGMVAELVEKVDPCFSRLVTPPCLKDDEFVGCPFELDNVKRLGGEDPLPPCQLFLSQKYPNMVDIPAGWDNNGDGTTTWYAKSECCGSTKPVWCSTDKVNQSLLRKMAKEYAALWGRDINTGKKVVV